MILASWTQFFAADANTNAKALAPGLGTDARNLDVSHGDFRGRASADVVFTLPGLSVQQKSIYRMGRDTASDTAYWLSWPTDVDVVRSLLATDPTERTYYTGDGIPKYTDNTHLATPPYPTGSVQLGVPAPTSTLLVAVGTAGTGPAETREYTETFRRGNGDESAPNSLPVELASCPGGSTAVISGLAPPPSGSSGIVTRRIYVSTGSEFLLCLEQSASLTTATDNGVTRTLVLATGGSAARPAWLTPPDDLAGLMPLWNGMLAGFSGKSYRTCVPFYPHAWPDENENIVPDTIVGMAKFGQNLVIVTTGAPYLAAGSLSLSDSPIAIEQAGVSKRSVVGVGHGVCWASKEGLCYTGLQGTFVMTERFISKAAWAALNPSSILGMRWNRYYIGSYDNGTPGGFMIDTLAPNGVIWLDQPAKAKFYDPLSQSLYLLDTGNVIRKWDSGTLLTATFTTGVKRVTEFTTPARAQVIATTYPVTFSLYGDGNLIYTRSVPSSLPFTLPGNYGGANEFKVTVSGTGPIEAVLLAEEMADLP
jgi:hypothetical protein